MISFSSDAANENANSSFSLHKCESKLHLSARKVNSLRCIALQYFQKFFPTQESEPAQYGE